MRYGVTLVMEAENTTRRPMTGPERAKRYREKRAASRTPTDVQFDRELRIVVIENVANPAMTPARTVGLVRERLVRRGFSADGIDAIILRYGDRR